MLQEKKARELLYVELERINLALQEANKQLVKTTW